MLRSCARLAAVLAVLWLGAAAASAQCLVQRIPTRGGFEFDIHETSAGYRIVVVDAAGAHVHDVETGFEVLTIPQFGYANFGTVSLSENFLLLGHPTVDFNFQGAAYVYNLNTGAQVQEWLAITCCWCVWFGGSVGALSTGFLVGESDPNSFDRSGAAYYYDSPFTDNPTRSFTNPAPSEGKFGLRVRIGQGSSGPIGSIGFYSYVQDFGRVYSYDLETGALLSVIEDPSDETFSFAFDVDGDTLVVTAEDHVYLYDVTNGTLLHDLPVNGFATVRLAQGLLGIVNDGDIALHDVPTGAFLVQIPRPLGSAGFQGLEIDRERLATRAIVDGQPEILVYSVPRPGNDANGNGHDDACDWIQGLAPDHWYRAVYEAEWSGAEAQAQAWGGHLATVRSAAENTWLTSTFASLAPFWIGFSDEASEGSFVWASGEPNTYDNWDPGQPDDLGGADWTVLDPLTGTWFDEAALPQRQGVIEVISGDCDGNALPDAFEIAEEPDLDWNGDGVLDDCTPANYCVATNNSTGVPAAIVAAGTPEVAENDFTLIASQLPLGEFGYFLMSESTAFVPLFGGSSGNLCLGPPIFRFNKPPKGEIGNSGASGTITFQPDLTNLPQGTVFVPGDTWYFQLWFRDGATSNTTDGFAVMFR